MYKGFTERVTSLILHAHLLQLIFQRSHLALSLLHDLITRNFSAHFLVNSNNLVIFTHLILDLLELDLVFVMHMLLSREFHNARFGAKHHEN